MKTLFKFNNLVNKLIYEYSIIDEQSNNVYIVKQGDTLSKISKLFNISVDEICKLNNIQDKNKISIGQKLILNNNFVTNTDNTDNTNIANKVQNKNIQNKNFDFLSQYNKLSEQAKKQVYFIARVLYSETATKTSEEEVLLVATVIYNRIGFKAAFPSNYKTAYDVVNSKTQFQCINDRKNSNWRQFRPDLNQRTKNAMKIALQLYNGTFKPLDANLPKWKKHYMYIDNSLNDTPDKFYSKRYWNLVNVEKTDHFKFYGLRPKNLRA